MTMQQPSFFIPHGGGPCFFMPDPKGIWSNMAAFLRTLPERLPLEPAAILVVSAHWETEGFAFTGADMPSLIYDYYGFPEATYQLTYGAPGAPAVAVEAARLLGEAGLPARVDPERGLDHGVFIPLKVAFPAAHIPVIEMSLDQGRDPSLHLEAGRALAPLRAQGVVIIGSGMSFHNMQGYGDSRFTAPSEMFDQWLTEANSLQCQLRADRLTQWASAPGARLSHPEEEHLLPLMVAAGAAEGPGKRIYSEQVLKAAISGFQFN
jgi:aromatic ring-opening dioxygenase catalytic subunit (LigB family)